LISEKLLKMKKTEYRILVPTVIVISALSLFCSSGNKNNQIKGLPGPNWKVIGPGAGGGVFIPTISPFDTSLVFAKGDMTGDFVTYDGGISWKSFNLMSVVQDFEYDPSDPDVVYAAGRGYLYDEDRGSGLSMLYRSENRGKTWKVIYPDISMIRPLEKLQSNSFLPSGLNSELPDGSIDIIKADPSDSNRIFLGLSPLRPYIGRLDSRTPKMVFLMETVNGGKNWKMITSLPGTEVLGIFMNDPHSTGDDEVTVITETTISIVNILTNATTIMPHPGGSILKAGGGFEKDKLLIYILTPIVRGRNGKLTGGIFRSSDAGKTWEDAKGNLKPDKNEESVPLFMCLGVCEKSADVVYLSVYTPDNSPDAIERVRYEIYKSIDSGNTWEPVYSANAKEVLSRNFNDSWLNRDYGPGWGGDILTLGVAPGDPDICYATDYGQIYKTSNGGITWNQVCSRNNADGSVSSRGIDLTCCYGVVFDPFDKNHLVISYIDIGIFHSFDGGESWFHLIDGIPSDWVNTCYDIAFDPSVKGQVWSAWANKHSLPRSSQFGDGLFRGYSGGIAYSTDGGKNWKKWNKGLPENSICTDILIDAASPVNDRTLYLSTFNQGVFKSTDNGKTWVSSDRGLKDNKYGWELRMAGSRIYLLCVRGWRGDKIIDGMLYYSDDQAANWQQLQLPEGVNAPSDLLIDPANPKRMYLSCWPKHVSGSDVCGGVYLTQDGGKTWNQCFNEMIRVFAAAFDPSDSRVLYINTFQNAAYRSQDSGQTWNRIEGYRFKWGHCPIPDPNNPGMLYLTTYGMSVFYGPAAGSAEEFGKIENIPDSWW
jgi:photosystem II stability/assembly factor-like uncharacterized protein